MDAEEENIGQERKMPAPPLYTLCAFMWKCPMHQSSWDRSQDLTSGGGRVGQRRRSLQPRCTQLGFPALWMQSNNVEECTKPVYTGMNFHTLKPLSWVTTAGSRTTASSRPQDPSSPSLSITISTKQTSIWLLLSPSLAVRLSACFSLYKVKLIMLL